MSSGSPVWNTCPRSPSPLDSVTSVISTSRDPQRPSAARNMSAGATALSTGMIGQHGRCRLVGRHRRRRLLRLRIAGGELRSSPLDGGDVGADHRLGSPMPDFPAVEPQRFVAEAARPSERVRHEEDGLAAALELRELVEALVREALVADRQHLVDEQHVGIDVDRHGEAEPHVHAGRIGLHRRVDEVLQLGELHDLVEALRDLALREAEHDAVDEDVLAAGDLRGETRRRARSAPRSGR